VRLHRYLRNRALRLTRHVSSPVRHWRVRRAPKVLALETVRRRLELVLHAMYGVQMRVTGASSAADEDLVLPAQLDARAGLHEALGRYRALALMQAARRARGTYDATPSADPLANDLYLLAESVAAEREVATRAPALAPVLGTLRFVELSARPKMLRLSHPELRVELLLRAVLAAPADQIPLPLPTCDDPVASRAWADWMAAEIRRSSGGRSPYRSLNPMTMWGLAWTRRRAPDAAESGGGETPSEEAEGATDHPDEAGDVSEGGAPSSSAMSTNANDDLPAALDDVRPESVRANVDRARAGGIAYPEWDEYTQLLRPRGATVSCSIAEEGDGGWADDVLRDHAPLVRQTRDRFAPLRARRLRLRRQRVGDELDLEECVTALTDRRIGHAPSERLYQVVRPARHTVAFMLLVDVSGSTGMRLDDGRTVLDIERMTLLLASEALATLGDPYAMLAFSGAGRHGVRVRTIKEFAEHDVGAVRRRISALVPHDNTRLGAAVRHATSVLDAQPAERRVLLILSDGKPNDVDWYQGEYAIEDSRRALHEARADGVHPFCLTVEQDEQDYLPHVFGKNGYQVLRKPEQLPAALLGVVDRMMRE
jgi:nitric oxide reductase NorD protein